MGLFEEFSAQEDGGCCSVSGYFVLCVLREMMEYAAVRLRMMRIGGDLKNISKQAMHHDHTIITTD